MSVSNLSEILPGWRNLGCSSPAPINLSISCQFLMTCEVYVEHSLMGLLLHVICSFSLYDFNFFFPLCLNFFSLILDMFLFEFIIFGTLDWLDLGIYFFSHVQEVLTIISNIFSYPSFSFFLLWLIIWMLVCSMLSQMCLRLSSFLFNLFFLYSFWISYFHHSILQLTYQSCFSCSTIFSLLGCCCLFVCFFNSDSVLFIILVQFSHSVMSNSLWSPGLQHARCPCPSPTPRANSNSCPSCRWWYPLIASSVIQFSSGTQSFPASGSFTMSQFFTSGGQSIWASASSIVSINMQDGFPLGWPGYIPFQFKGLSRVLSNATVQNRQFFSAQFSL